VDILFGGQLTLFKLSFFKQKSTRHYIIKTKSCKRSINVNDKLNDEKITKILMKIRWHNRLDDTDIFAIED
jgi:hypothetical protein